MSRPALKFEYRFKDAVRDAGLRTAISNAINTTYGVTYGAFGWPCKAAGIQELHAENLEIADLTGIENLTGLQKLWLDGNTGITTIGRLGSPVPLSSLVELHLSGCTRLQGDATGLKRLHSLQILDLSGCWNIYSLNRTLYDPCVTNGYYFSNIRYLNLSGCTGLTNCGISVFARMDFSNLEKLNLSGCTGIDSLDSLVANQSLRAGSQIEVKNIPLTNIQEDVNCLCSRGVIVTDDDINICPASPCLY